MKKNALNKKSQRYLKMLLEKAKRCPIFIPDATRNVQKNARKEKEKALAGAKRFIEENPCLSKMARERFMQGCECVFNASPANAIPKNICQESLPGEGYFLFAKIKIVEAGKEPDGSRKFAYVAKFTFRLG
jgi:hypothetical protein